MGLSIRPFDTGSDYEGIASVATAARPYWPRSAGEWRLDDTRRDPKCTHGRWVAENSTGIVAWAACWNREWMYNPAKFEMFVVVHPDHQGQRVGARLYDHVCEELAGYNPVALWSSAREDETRSTRFLADRGFVEEFRGWESRLPVADFDFSLYEGQEEKVRAQGIEIRTLRDLQDADPCWDHKLYDLLVTVGNDVPTPAPITMPTFDRWRDQFCTSHDLLPDGQFIAVHEGEFVGLSQLWDWKDGDDFLTGMTGVRREWRRKGIALALKLRAVAYAKSVGRPAIRTGNATVNRPMLNINERLGFEKYPVWIDFVKTL